MTTVAAVVALACLPALAAAGCGSRGAGPRADGSARDAGDPLALFCARYGADVDGGGPAPAFADLQRIFDDNCAACHYPGADLDLYAGHSYAQLVGHAAPAAEACGGTLVVPGDAAASYLYQKLTSDHPCAGSRMPLGDFGYSALPDCVPARVGAWIAAGAPGP
jgi:hypothetical protein